MPAEEKVYILLGYCKISNKKMERYSRFFENGYRFEVRVPTTIFDAKAGVIRAYRRRKCVDEVYFKLRKMPEWNVPLQAILLGEKDERTLERITTDLLKRLPTCEQ